MVNGLKSCVCVGDDEELKENDAGRRIDHKWVKKRIGMKVTRSLP